MTHVFRGAHIVLPIHDGLLFTGSAALDGGDNTDTGLGGQGSPARGGSGHKDPDSLTNLELIDESFATTFAFE